MSQAQTTMTTEEKRAKRRGYSQGYNAGRKRTATELEKWLRIHEEIHDASSREKRERRDRFFSAALTGLLAAPSSTWKIGDQPVNPSNADMYVDLAARFAENAMRKMQ